MPDKKQLEYLNNLRLSGVTNMFGAAPYLEAAFALTPEEALKVLKYWMENFDEH